MADVLVKFAGSEQILSVIQTAAFKKMSAGEVCEILDHVKDDTVVFDVKDEIFLKVVDGKVEAVFDSSDDSSTLIEPLRVGLVAPKKVMGLCRAAMHEGRVNARSHMQRQLLRGTTHTLARAPT